LSASIREAAKRVGRGELSIEQQVEAFIFAHGDDRGIAGRMGISGDIKLRGRDIQLRKELAAIDEWLATEERENPLSALETLHRREIAAASTMFMQGVLSYPADAKKFDPTISALVQLCRICDLPIVEYPDGIELFRCETQEIDQRYLAYRVTVRSSHLASVSS
jgi:hypothetical protein